MMVISSLTTVLYGIFLSLVTQGNKKVIPPTLKAAENIIYLTQRHFQNRTEKKKIPPTLITFLEPPPGITRIALGNFNHPSSNSLRTQSLTYLQFFTTETQCTAIPKQYRRKAPYNHPSTYNPESHNIGLANLTPRGTRTVKGMAPPQMKSRLEMIRKGPGTHLGLILRNSSCQTPKRRLETAWGVVLVCPENGSPVTTEEDCLEGSVVLFRWGDLVLVCLNFLPCLASFSLSLLRFVVFSAEWRRV
ncbi:hypothetical protein CEXT_100711 [Caerostris extrusa]|uniref:Uncharacterized protein n=1 Tax=Caerostris extrusa TaxID=172846 RepID=A0AAV4W808_CAEEX|nr:hypothetical protein CEXT_100711 [Caerostris extrusa]